MHQQLTYYDFESDFEYQLQLHETIMSRTAVECNRAATEEYFKAHLGAELEVTHAPAIEPLPPETRAEITTSVTQFMNLFQRHQHQRLAAAPPHVLQVQKMLHVAHAPHAYHVAQMLQVSHTTTMLEHTVRQISQQVYQLAREPPGLYAAAAAAAAAPAAPATHAARSSPARDDAALRTAFLRNLKQRILNVIKERNAHCQLKRQVAIIDALSEVLDRDPLRVLALVGYQAIFCHDEFNIPKTARRVDEEAARRNERKLQEMAEEFCLTDLSLDVIRACDKHSKVRQRLYEPPPPDAQPRR